LNVYTTLALLHLKLVILTTILETAGIGLMNISIAVMNVKNVILPQKRLKKKQQIGKMNVTLNFVMQCLMSAIDCIPIRVNVLQEQTKLLTVVTYA
jgi:hypothetical protein